MDGRVFLKTALGLLTFLAFTNVAASGKTTLKNIKSTDMDTLELTQEWDKTFPQSDRVEHSKITFHNRYGITLAADVYKPKNARGRLAAVAVSGPYGAVKSRFPGRYAQTLAERGFLTVAFDPSFYGERRRAPLPHFARNQHGRFQRGGRLPDRPRRCRSRAHRHSRYLRRCTWSSR